MLKRIQEVRSVGCFYKMKSGNLDFSPLTIIYGENTYGKSTLCDVFRSLSENKPDYIINRRSIPNPDNFSQLVKLSFQFNGNTSETPFNFKDSDWDKKLPSDVNLLVFDSNFIYRNVFTGLSIERSNYENVTQFVLGEKSVEKAENIAKNKSKLRKLKKDLRELKNNSFEGINEIKKFIELDVQLDKENLDKKSQEIYSELEKNRQIEKNIDDILSRNEPKYLNFNIDLESFISELNSLLELSFEQVHEETKESVLLHIQNKTKNTDTTQSWIHKGLHQILGDNCPFCGQELKDPAVELINLYKRFFDKSYEKYNEELTEKLLVKENEISNFEINIDDLIDRNKAILDLYSEIKKDDFKENIELLDKLSESVNDCISSWNNKYVDFKQVVVKKIKGKNDAIHKVAEPINTSNYLSTFRQLEETITNYESTLKKIKEKIERFKNTLNLQKIRERISELEGNSSSLELQKRRLNSKKACQNYIDLKEKISTTENKIENLESELEKDQTAFLDQYFQRINKIFNRLGSKNFKINKTVSRRGDLPTIQIKASYSGTSITKDKLKSFFSESDRRALALAIFWAKIESMDEDERKDSIVILDDPVTSFDDGRIDQSIRLMNPEKYSLKQLIIISHYPRYLKTFFDRANNDQISIGLLKLDQDENGSNLTEANSSEFVETPHQRVLRKIIGFIEKKHQENIENYLRVYLENELRSRYRKQIIELSLENTQLGDLINNLNEDGVIKDEIANELHEFRKSLNPMHHKIRDRTIEQRISLSNEVLNFIYNKM